MEISFYLTKRNRTYTTEKLSLTTYVGKLGSTIQILKK